MTIVRGYGPTDSGVVIVGEAPGRDEAAKGRPFVGKSGAEQAFYFRRCGLNVESFYRTNVMKLYQDGNPDPTPAQIAEWTPILGEEIENIRPSVIVAVGRFAARFFLGDRVDMDASHGRAHEGGAFDPSIAHRACGAVCVPVFHPAWGLHDSDKRALIVRDYENASAVIKDVRAGREVVIPFDEFEGRTDYRDVDGREIAGLLGAARSGPSGLVIGIDTEGWLSDPWSLQISLKAGTGLMLRCRARHFAEGVAALQSLADRGALFILHNSMFDMGMLRKMGLELRAASIFDTQYASYLMRLEPQGLKALAYRRLGIRMTSYEATVGHAAEGKQVDWLIRAARGKWPAPDPRMEWSNDGSGKIYTPNSVQSRARKILLDYMLKNTPDAPVDLEARWGDVDEEIAEPAVAILGRFPFATLDDLPLDKAIAYSVLDADATRRLYFEMEPVLAREGLLTLMHKGMKVLPIFEEMQATGLPASREKFVEYNDYLEDAMGRLQRKISKNFYAGDPFNPASQNQTRSLMRRRGLRGLKRTKTGDVSTAKKSIEHLRHEDEAIGAVISWREHQKVRDAFCGPILRKIPLDAIYHPVRCQIKPTRVHTRRLASANPNMLAMPARNDLGKRLRECFIAPPGTVLAAWDLSQIELRMMAHESQDPIMLDVYRSKRDLHAETAAAIFKVPVGQVTAAQRTPAKTAGFGIMYGISASALYDQLRMMSETGITDWNIAKCDRLIKSWLGVYDGVRAYIDRAAVDAAKTGIVVDRWGMKRYIPGIWSHEEHVREEAGRIAVSHRIQGGAQGMIQNAMIWLDPYICEMQQAGLNIHWSLQIHDEIIFWLDEELFEPVNELVLRALTQHHGVEDIRVPIEASSHVSTTWGELK